VCILLIALQRPELDNPLVRTLAGLGVNGASCGCAVECSSGAQAGSERCAAAVADDTVVAAAREFLKRHVCGVFLAERPLESAAYLGYVLGLPPHPRSTGRSTRGVRLGISHQRHSRPVTPLRSENTFLGMAASRHTTAHANRSADGWIIPDDVAGSFTTRNAADYALHADIAHLLDLQLVAMQARVPRGPS
jgi:hypothetical protein